MSKTKLAYNVKPGVNHHYKKHSPTLTNTQSKTRYIDLTKLTYEFAVK